MVILNLTAIPEETLLNSLKKVVGMDNGSLLSISRALPMLIDQPSHFSPSNQIFQREGSKHPHQGRKEDMKAL